jgi:hypothetical protein
VIAVHNLWTEIAQVAKGAPCAQHHEFDRHPHRGHSDAPGAPHAVPGPVHRAASRAVRSTVACLSQPTDRRWTVPPETLADVALDQALARIGELSGRLWAVRSAHRPRPRAGLLGGHRCAECGRAYPCPTTRVVCT